MDVVADFSILDPPHAGRQNSRKICYFLGIIVNAEGSRFIDGGQSFRNYA